jgi:hypothetical protein
MPNYRAYAIRDDGHLMPATDLECATDQEAITTVKGFLNGQPVELWLGTRLIGRFEKGYPDAILAGKII